LAATEEKDMKKLEGKVALVTGASRGIGAAIAERLAADGTAVAINYAKSVQDAQAVAKRIREAGGKMTLLKADLSDPAQTKALADTAVGEFGRLDILVYSATKSALDALTRVWAAELGPKGVTVNAVSPGPVDTAMLRGAGFDEDVLKGVIARTPLGRLGVPSDVADVVAFLASTDARWVTGQVIESSGGINQ
jgi:3-oxoacyl-[acyl-carrier protein] reductase